MPIGWPLKSLFEARLAIQIVNIVGQSLDLNARHYIISASPPALRANQQEYRDIYYE
jgi:hypothetical protein